MKLNPLKNPAIRRFIYSILEKCNPREFQAIRMYKSSILNALNMLLRPNILKIEKINYSKNTNYQMFITSKDKNYKYLDAMNGLFIP